MEDMEIDDSCNKGRLWRRDFMSFEGGAWFWGEEREILPRILPIKREEVSDICKFIRTRRHSFLVPQPLKVSPTGTLSGIASLSIKAEYLIDDETEPTRSDTDCDSFSIGFSDYYPSDSFIKTEPWEAPQIEIGQVFFIRHTNLTTWVKARLEQKTLNNEYAMRELRTGKPHLRKSSQIAYFDAPEGLIKVGARVLAPLTIFKETGEMNRHTGLRSGVIGELPSVENENRFLVIFDEGFWLYVHPGRIKMMLKQSNRPWKYVVHQHRKLVHSFFRDIDREMVVALRSDYVKVRREGSIHTCTVFGVDCSLLLVNYQGNSKIEWIHRRDPRLSVFGNTSAPNVLTRSTSSFF